MVLSENFAYSGTSQNFDRDSYATLAEMKAVKTKKMPSIFHATCEETSKLYVYNKTNTDDEILGKWREVGSGSINGGNADTVNNHTVNSDVPENAVFTDTIYDDTGIRVELAKKADTAAIPNKVSDLSNDSNYQTAEQVNNIVTIEIAKVVSDAPENLNTLKEMSDWIAGHENDASAMNSAISNNKTSIETLQTNVSNINTSLDGKLNKTFIGDDVGNKVLSTDENGNVVLKDNDSNGINDSVVSSESTWSSVKTRDTISSLLNDNEASTASTWTGSKIDNELNTIKDAVTSLESREDIPVVTNGKDVVLRKITQNRSITDLPLYLNRDGSKGYKVDDLYFTYDTRSLALGIKAWLTDNGITPAKGSTYADVAQIKVYIPSGGGYTYLSTKFSFDNSTYLSYSVEYKGTDYIIVSCQYDYNTSEVKSETFTGLNVFNLVTLIPALSNGYIQEDILTVFHNWFSIYKPIGIQDAPSTFNKEDAILTQDTIVSTTMDSKKVGAWDLGNLVSFATGSLQRLIFTVNPEGTKLAAYANKETDRAGGISGDFFGKNLLAPLNTFEVLDDMSTLPTPPSGALGIWTVKPGAAGQPESSNVGGTLIIAYITGSLYSTSIEYIGTRIALYFTKGTMYYALGYGGKYYPTSSWNASSGGGPMWYKIASTLV